MTQPLRIYDSFRRQKLDFVPLKAGQVSMYLCGPTTYDSAHIGHAYSAICFDVVRRSLQWLGYDVRFVRNITDVDDKIIARARETGEPPLELAARYADEYNRDMACFGILPPDVEPRVSTHIPAIIALIERLIAAGKAYAVDGDVYFYVDSFPDYGKLSGQSISDLRSGARVEVDERKRSPVDFALWKSAKPGEPAWSSPWGKGRPGWHIECSAMTQVHMGETFDLHAGGKDLIFPHHENEIAQSQGAFGPDSFARFWLHNGFLSLGGDAQKMSRSLGNVLGCETIASAAGPEAMRLFVVSHHYRSPVTFEIEDTKQGPVFRDLEACDRRLDYFYSTLERLDAYMSGSSQKKPLPHDDPGETIPEAQELLPKARVALSDDFNTSIVLAAIGEATRAANKLLDEPKTVPKPVRRRSLHKLAHDIRNVAQGALGILNTPPQVFLQKRRERLARKRNLDIHHIETLLAARKQARSDKDFDRADAIRDELTALGVEVKDTGKGVDWRIAD